MPTKIVNLTPLEDQITTFVIHSPNCDPGTCTDPYHSFTVSDRLTLEDVPQAYNLWDRRAQLLDDPEVLAAAKDYLFRIFARNIPGLDSVRFYQHVTNEAFVRMLSSFLLRREPVGIPTLPTPTETDTTPASKSKTRK